MAIDTISLRSRRALLAGSLGGLAALAAQALGRPAPVHAAHEGAVQLGHDNNFATTQTVIVNTTAGSQAFAAFATDSGTGVRGGSSSGDGVVGITSSGHGVLGTSFSGNGVHGASNSGDGLHGTSATGYAVYGQASGANETSIYGFKSNGGVAVWGDIQNASSGYSAVFGRTNGSGPGVTGENSANGRGTWGRAFGTGDGIYGESSLGRGGRFKGKTAQIRLDPSTAATHPSSGAGGDLFVDASKRLWFCRGGTTWVRLA